MNPAGATGGIRELSGERKSLIWVIERIEYVD